MKKNKPNISLSALAEVSSGGVLLAVRKGFNEVFRTTRAGRVRSRADIRRDEYSDMISVIICTASRPELALLAAESVDKQRFNRKKFEIIVVNNSAESFPKERLPKSARLVNEPVLGLSRARNSGAAAARGSILLYMDDDALARDGLLAAMYDAFGKHPRAAIIGGQIFLKLPQPTPEIFLEGRESLWSGYTVPYTGFREIREQYEFPYGACFAVRHGALDALGGFSEAYGRCGDNFAGGEETALCFAARRAGMKLGIEPRAAVTHCVGRERFTKEHVRRTIREGIVTTQRLFSDGDAQSGWTEAYIKERINIINSEIKRLTERGRAKEIFYKQCELAAFRELNIENSG